MDWGAIVGGYAVVSLIIGAIGGLAVGIATWHYGASAYGAWVYLFGWIPGGILGFVSFWIIAALWPLSLIVVGYFWLKNAGWDEGFGLAAKAFIVIMAIYGIIVAGNEIMRSPAPSETAFDPDRPYEMVDAP